MEKVIQIIIGYDIDHLNLRSLTLLLKY